MNEIDLAELLHENSKTRPELGPPQGAASGGPELPLVLMDGSIKRYHSTSWIPLPPPSPAALMDVSEAICQRRSAREFSSEPIPLEVLSRVLFNGNGVREVHIEDGYRHYRRNTPSAGNLGSVDLYPLILRVSGVHPGVYHYQPCEHQLNRIAPGTALGHLESVLLQPGFTRAGAIIVLGSSLARVRAKYGIRGYRYACMDAGHVAQNLCLVAAAAGLGACTLGSFDDDRLNGLLGLDGLHEAGLYIVAIGAVSRNPPT